jgi:xanthine dehydrogenase accessory factor
VSADLLELARSLSVRSEPYVLATVVWRRAPSSGKVGSRAVITADGHITGWLGGACAEPAVISESKRALEEGTPRLMFLGPPEELAEHQRDGVISVPIACQSEGALEVYVEPVFPKPKVLVIGRSPAVDALAGMAAALGWRAAVVDDGGSAGDHPDIDEVFTSLDLGAAGADEASFVVVATQGHYDEDALRRALDTPARYVGLVASRKRAEAVMGYLRDRGLSGDQLARVHAPAGLDLGHVAPEEIAVAIMAELVQLRATGDLGPRVEMAPASEMHEAIDPVCGMTVQVAAARYRATHQGRTYYFCSAGCRQGFEANPAAYLVQGPGEEG